MKSWQVDRHIDTTCPGSPQPGKASSSTSNSRGANSFGAGRNPFNPPTPTKQPERLPALAYSMLKDNALRKKMSELGISTGGTRQMLEKRHQEWVTIWNANCDSAKPKKRSELLHDLEVWERTMGSRAPTMSRAANMGAQIKDKEFDGAAWAAKHGTSFKGLIAQARNSRSKAQPKVEETSKSEGVPEEPSVTRGGKGLGGVVSAPMLPGPAFIDLTELPPSSQPQPPDSPSRHGFAQPIFLGKETPYLSHAEDVPSYNPPGEAGGAPS